MKKFTFLCALLMALGTARAEVLTLDATVVEVTKKSWVAEAPDSGIRAHFDKGKSRLPKVNLGDHVKIRIETGHDERQEPGRVAPEGIPDVTDDRAFYNA